MQKTKASRSNRLIQIVFIVLGIAICTILGISFVVLDEAGAFSKASWELIESPIRFKHIADATTRKVWAVTDDNKYYCLGFPGCDQWMETEKVSVNSHEEYNHTTINNDTCKSDVIIKYPRDPQGKVVECAFTIEYFGVETKSIVYRALLDDGTIWAWKSSGPWYVGLGMFIMLASPVVGLLLGLFSFRVFEKRQKNRNKATD
jgi:hypothetical protein